MHYLRGVVVDGCCCVVDLDLGLVFDIHDEHFCVSTSLDGALPVRLRIRARPPPDKQDYEKRACDLARTHASSPERTSDLAARASLGCLEGGVHLASKVVGF